MKTKLFSLIVVAVFALLGTNNTDAQGLYHPGKIIGGADFKYVCEIPWMEPDVPFTSLQGKVRVRSINNRFTGIAQRDENGKIVPMIDPPNIFTGRGNAFKMFHAFINSIFDDADKQREERDRTLYVSAYIDPLTGKIIDIEFEMDEESVFARVAPEKYFQLETMMKDMVTFEVKDIGRGYNYVFDSWIYRASWFGKTIR